MTDEDRINFLTKPVPNAAGPVVSIEQMCRGITARTSAAVDRVLVHPSRAAKFHALIILRDTKPPWWRVFARRRWNRAMNDALVEALS